MRALTGLLGLLWALGSLAFGVVLLVNSFRAPTPAKEGGLAQLALLLGGILLALFALGLVWASARLFKGEAPLES